MKKFILSFIIFFTSSIYAADLLVVDINPGYFKWSSNASIVLGQGLFAKRTLPSHHTLFAENEHCQVTSRYKETHNKMNAGNHFISEVNTNAFKADKVTNEIIITFSGAIIYLLTCKVADPSFAKVSEINKLLNDIPIKIVIR